MSEFHVEVVKLQKIGKHPNADSLSITSIGGKGGYPVIFRTGDFSEGELAIYIPVDAIVPSDNPAFAFLGHSTRIKAKKLRGIFSQGLLVPLKTLEHEAIRPEDFKEGDNVQKQLRIEKYQEDVHLFTGTENEANPGFLYDYTDLESIKRHPGILREGELVVITEKIHGANARFIYSQDRLWVGSHHNVKKRDERNVWWNAAIKGGLEEKLKRKPDYLFFGEVYGDVQDLRYGLGKGQSAYRMFDVFDIKDMKYLDYEDFRDLCKELELEVVPVLYEGPWKEELRQLAEGESVLSPGQIKEGIVIKPLTERYEPTLGRCILKLVGEQYLLRHK